MAQIFNPTGTLDDQSPTTTNLASVNVSASASPEFIPTRTLNSSVASQAFNGNGPNFAAVAADIPDNFATNEHPKLKFMFTVQFQPRTGLTLPETGSDSMDDMKFALKRATRPQPQVVQQEVNFYGLRQKVDTRMDYGTVTLAFYDDVVNRAHNIVTQYINLVSPISNISREQADNLAGSAGGARSYGALPSRYGPFQWMRVTHHVTDDKSTTPGTGKQIFYDYVNPKIVQVNLDELDMTQSDTNTVEIVFSYDYVYITYSDNPATNPLAVDNSQTPISGGIISGNPLDNTASSIGIPKFIGSGSGLTNPF